jgi:riboflavin synthase
VADVVAVEQGADSRLVSVALPAALAELMVPHGSVALDGVSLTVNALPAPDVCQVSIIPFTWEHTNLPELKEGDAVNLEGDTIGKYVRHLLGLPAARASTGTPEPEHVLRAWGYEQAPGG